MGALLWAASLWVLCYRARWWGTALNESLDNWSWQIAMITLSLDWPFKNLQKPGQKPQNGSSLRLIRIGHKSILQHRFPAFLRIRSSFFDFFAPARLRSWVGRNHWNRLDLLHLRAHNRSVPRILSKQMLQNVSGELSASFSLLCDDP